MILLNAIRSNQTKRARNLLNKNVQADFQDTNGWTPLLVAAEMGNHEVVELLLKKGVEVKGPRLVKADFYVSPNDPTGPRVPSWVYRTNL